MNRDLVAELLDALKTLMAFECVRYANDRGSSLGGYQSNELSRAIANADAAIEKAEATPCDCRRYVNPEGWLVTEWCPAHRPTCSVEA